MISASASDFTIVGNRKVYKMDGAPFEVPLRYSVVGLLGSGSYGTVCSVIDDRTGEKFAVKKCTKLQEDDRAELALRELEVLNFVRHRNVLSLHTIFPSRSAPQALEDVYVSMPLLETNLSHILRSRQQFEEPHRQYFAYQLVCGMHHLHTAGIVHADLKPSNLMVELDCSLKIGDFGLAQLVNGDHPLLSYVVTPPYRAPELLAGNTSYGPEIDVWAAGCIVAQLYKRHRLFTFSDSSAIMLQEISGALGKLPADVVQNDVGHLRLSRIPNWRTTTLEKMLPEVKGPNKAVVLDFLHRMLEVDPRKRATTAELLRHPYIACYMEPCDQFEAPSVMLGTHATTRLDALKAIGRLIDEHNPKPLPTAIPPALPGPQLVVALKLLSSCAQASQPDELRIQRLAVRFAQRQRMGRAAVAVHDQRRHSWSPRAWTK